VLFSAKTEFVCVFLFICISIIVICNFFQRADVPENQSKINMKSVLSIVLFYFQG